MNKLVWIGIAVAVVLSVVALVLYFMPNDRSYRGVPQMPAPNAGQAPQVLQPPSGQKAGAVEASFDASAYEVNYTLVLTISLGGVAMTTEGWFVVGVGPSGNYSFGVFTSLPLRDVATYKSATEGGAAYVATCLYGHCTVDRRKWPSALIEGVNAARTAVGQCRHLGYAGTLYEERGMLKPKTPPSRIEDASGNYTAYICEVNGVALSVNLTATALARGEAVYITMKIEAVKAGPYRPDTYRTILKEIKTNK